MDIENAGDLIYYTYYMLDWAKVKQMPSEIRCVSCGKAMTGVGPVKDKKGQTYDGRVCHSCKSVLWVKR